MKSIKEKAKELVEKRVELSREESIAYFQGIEEGANYVLEKICEIVDNNSSCEKVVLEIGKLMIQLKK